MRSILRLTGLAAPPAAFALALLAWAPWTAGAAAEAVAAAPPLSAALAHVGRDPQTGMPTSVDDRFIAALDEARDRYGKDEREAVPPPPVDGLDVAGLRIPSLGINAPAARFGLDIFGRLDVPQDRTTVGWHPAYSALPGQHGATFLAAHYEYAGEAGVFHGLSGLHPQGEVVLELSDGSTHRYRVTSVADYDLGVIDMGALLQGREGTESLTLMTCSGSYSDGTYNLRTVVLAVRVEP